MNEDGEEIWLFGYGSLVFRPPESPLPTPAGGDGPIIEQRRAVVTDWARRFWQGSPDHRGSPERPGRVATMLRWPGKVCTGLAYRLRPGAAPQTLSALDAREVRGYVRVEVPLRDAPSLAPFGTAITYVALPSNPDFLGLASPAVMADQIRLASGLSGTNRDYVLSLAAALRALGESSEDEVFELEALLLSHR
jgi:cation transport protein ChaC